MAYYSGSHFIKVGKAYCIFVIFSSFECMFVLISTPFTFNIAKAEKKKKTLQRGLKKCNQILHSKQILKWRFLVSFYTFMKSFQNFAIKIMAMFGSTYVWETVTFLCEIKKNFKEIKADWSNMVISDQSQNWTDISAKVVCKMKWNLNGEKSPQTKNDWIVANKFSSFNCCKFLFNVYIYPAHLHGQDVTQGKFFSGVKKLLLLHTGENDKQYLPARRLSWHWLTDKNVNERVSIYAR